MGYGAFNLGIGLLEWVWNEKGSDVDGYGEEKVRDGEVCRKVGMRSSGMATLLSTCLPYLSMWIILHW